MASPQIRAAAQRLADKRKFAGMVDDRFSVEAARAAELAAEGPDPAGTMVSEVDARGVPARWAVASGASTTLRIVYFHGGGYVTGGWHTHRTICTWLSHFARAAVLFVDYRLAPEYRFPRAVEDAWNAYRWAWTNGPDGRGAAETVLVAGDSAGAALAMDMMIRSRDERHATPAAGALVSGMLDLDEATSEFLRTYGRARDLVSLYLPAGENVRHPWASPLHADLAGLSPMIVQVGEADYVKGDSLRLKDRAAGAGISVTLEVWPEMPHVWHRYAPGVPESMQALERIGTFFRAVQKQAA